MLRRIKRIDLSTLHPSEPDNQNKRHSSEVTSCVGVVANMQATTPIEAIIMDTRQEAMVTPKTAAKMVAVGMNEVGKVVVLATIILLLFLSSACTRQDIESADVSKVGISNDKVVTVDVDAINAERTYSLSDILDSYEMVQLESAPDAFFRGGGVVISDNYIAIIPDGGPAKLFSRKGKYIGNIGALGNGPGEYRIKAQSVVINENVGEVYLAPMQSKAVLVYDLEGSYLRDIDIEGSLQKPIITTDGDSAIALVHLAFADCGDRFNACRLLQSNDSPVRASYVYVPGISVNLDDEDPNKAGFSNELFGEGIGRQLNFQLLGRDTLLCYQPDNSDVFAKLAVNASTSFKKDGYFRLREFLGCYLIEMMSRERSEYFVVNKEGRDGFKLYLVNDYLGGMEAYSGFHNGYFINIYPEPEVLAEEIKKFMALNNLTPDIQIQLKKQMDFCLEGNAIILFGKLKPDFPYDL